MRIRVRVPAGQSTISIGDTATVRDLQDRITENTSIPSYDIKYGYPPTPLDLAQYDPAQSLGSLGLKLDGEQLIISEKAPETADQSQPSSQSAAASSSQKPSDVPQTSASAEDSKPLSLTRKQNTSVENDPPEIPCPEHGGTMVLRIMPDDNSCLFRAVGSAVMGDVDAMTEMRSIVAQTIQSKPDVYSAAVLEKSPDDYCRWIQSEDSWGGGIELSILSDHFEIEICSIDVQSLRVDRFNEGKPTRCIVVYSGIHYDTIAVSPSDPPFTHAYAPPDFDTKVFDSVDPVPLERAVALCQILHGKHYFTDTAAFQIKCNTCGGMFVGEKGATKHAAETGHTDFGEAA